MPTPFPNTSAKLDWLCQPGNYGRGADYYDDIGRPTGRKKTRINRPRGSNAKPTAVTLSEADRATITRYQEHVRARAGRKPSASATISVALELLRDSFPTDRN